MTTPRDLQGIQAAIWKGSLPLEIRLAAADCRTFDKSDPYMIQFPRLSYLPFLLPQLLAFFAPDVIQDATVSTAWLSFEDVPLKWHYPVGLLYDLFSGASPAHARSSASFSDRSPSHARSPSAPRAGEFSEHRAWQLILHFSEFPDSMLVRLDTEGRVIHDAFINSVKEADFLRNGSANAIMKLSKDDSTRLWDSVKDYDQSTFLGIHNRLLPTSSELRHIPIRIYLPAVAPTTVASPLGSPPAGPAPGSPGTDEGKSPSPAPTHLKVVQPLVLAMLPQTRTPQTVGTALHAALPSLFPSRKTPIQAFPVLHGAVLPMTAPLEEILRSAAYMDGWLHLGIEMHG